MSLMFLINRMQALLLAGLFGLMTFVPVCAQPLDAQQQLTQFVEQVRTATGRFSQYTVGPQGQTKPAQTGEFAFRRPGQFKWQVTKPYEQLVLSDGKEVFQFDPDLNQVTIRKVDQAIGASPAAILFGSGALDKAFVVTRMPDRDGFLWLRAKPRASEAGFVHVDIGMKEGLPHRIVLLDAFGQTTRVDLSGIIKNVSLKPDAFQFTPPAGVDTVRMQ